MRKLTAPEPNLVEPNAFGFPSVWIPFGKETVIEGAQRSYKVDKSKVLDPNSIDTLAGIPIFCSHPGIHTKHNSDKKEFIQVGVARDVWRESADGLGGEVLCRITSPSVYQLLEDKVLTESSPAYKMEGRVFNHLGLFQKGESRGGEIMTILLEGKSDVENKEVVFEGYDSITVPFSPEIYGIELDASKSVSYLKTNMVDTLKESTVNNKNNNNNIMEDLIKELIAKVDNLGVKNKLELDQAYKADMVVMEGKVANVLKEKTDLEKEWKGKFDDAFSDGYKKGSVAGQVLFTAKSYGYEGEVYDDAIEFVVSKAFPTIALEGKDLSFTTHLFDGAVKEIQRQEEAKKTVEVESSKDAKEDEIVMEGKEGQIKQPPTISTKEETVTYPTRYKLSEASL